MTRGAHPSGGTPITATLRTPASYSSCTHTTTATRPRRLTRVKTSTACSCEGDDRTHRDGARDAVGEEAGEAAAAVLGRGGVGLGEPAREQARVGVGAEGQDEHRCGLPLPRRGGLELQQLQRLGGEADLLPDGAHAEHRRR